MKFKDLKNIKMENTIRIENGILKIYDDTQYELYSGLIIQVFGTTGIFINGELEEYLDFSEIIDLLLFAEIVFTIYDENADSELVEIHVDDYVDYYSEHWDDALIYLKIH